MMLGSKHSQSRWWITGADWFCWDTPGPPFTSLRSDPENLLESVMSRSTLWRTASGGVNMTNRTTADVKCPSALPPGSQRARCSRVLLSLHHLFKLRYSRDVGPHQVQQQTVFRRPRHAGALGGTRTVALTGTRSVPGSTALWKGNISSSNPTTVHRRFWESHASHPVGGVGHLAVRSRPLLHNLTLELPALLPK